MTQIFLGLGSNLGEREQALFSAIEQLVTMHAISAPVISPLYQSPALLPEGAPNEWNIDFINAVAQAETQLSPEALLQAIKQTEAAMGRTNRGHWAPREIDIDILAYEDVVLELDTLHLPHPHIATRDFVLLPWCDIAPNWMHPITRLSIRSLCANLTNSTARPIEAGILKVV